jgi:hypothetical protein
MLRTLALAALLVAAPASRLAAQEQITNPPQLDASSPRAQRAKAAADLVLGGDRAQLDAWLKEHAAPAFDGQNLAALLDAMKAGAREILRYDDLPGGAVGVVLARTASGEPERAIVVRLEPAAPHRVTRLGVAQLTMGG